MCSLWFSVALCVTIFLLHRGTQRQRVTEFFYSFNIINYLFLILIFFSVFLCVFSVFLCVTIFLLHRGTQRQRVTEVITNFLPILHPQRDVHTNNTSGDRKGTPLLSFSHLLIHSFTF